LEWTFYKGRIYFFGLAGFFNAARSFNKRAQNIDALLIKERKTLTENEHIFDEG
jgi:hypothetical protein